MSVDFLLIKIRFWGDFFPPKKPSVACLLSYISQKVCRTTFARVCVARANAAPTAATISTPSFGHLLLESLRPWGALGETSGIISRQPKQTSARWTWDQARLHPSDPKRLPTNRLPDVAEANALVKGYSILTHFENTLAQHSPLNAAKHQALHHLPTTQAPKRKKKNTRIAKVAVLVCVSFVFSFLWALYCNYIGTKLFQCSTVILFLIEKMCYLYWEKKRRVLL